MAQVPDSVQQKSGFFHSLDITATEATQYPFESLYKGDHNILPKEVFGEIIPYAINATQADLNVANNPTLLKKYTQVSLTEIPGSNKQAWYINDAGTFVRRWISPQDVPHATTADPSYGYQAQLYKETGELITPTEGVWFCRYSAGIVHFAPGYTPDTMGWGNPKITCYVYIGKSILDVINSGGVPEAPNDGRLYVRKSLSWSPILELQENKFTVTSAFVAGETIDLTTGLGDIAGICTITGSVLLPNTQSRFETDAQIKIFRNGILQSKTEDFSYVSETELKINNSLDIGEEIVFLTSTLY